MDYTSGLNWVDDSDSCATANVFNTVSHLGMHCDAEELIEWRKFFGSRDIAVAQEVFTQSHTNAYLVENGRKYNYVIFDTKPILGVDLKFIVRIDKE